MPDGLGSKGVGCMTEYNLPEKDDAPWLNTQYDGFMTHEEMLEEAAKREKENKVLEIAKQFIEEHSEAMEQLAEIERQKLDNRCERDIDEIVLEDLKMVHYEVMEADRSAWVGFYESDGTVHHLHIYVEESTGRLRTIWDPNTNVP